ncbi:hypothetical protein FGU65_05085 [Methanoculleus sp. FWC-SCC1]|uniref:Uncharacterized protein n=1 Tax=Methanoculleus frigidifontis TaxID=2584085 RepID=A0ABT8M8K3_9EURY|nr:hypothetical protein [Methanoculleus sp. FWC-SCC1]MDN7024270.1 hypothetical protein [Methanoculleus sp. FWC-SCC1]
MPPASALVRSVDPAYPTNRNISILTLGVFAAAVALNLALGAGVLASGIAAVLAAASVFLAWALARELDPEKEYAAFVAAGLAGGALLLLPLPDPGIALLALLLLRMVNRTTGLAAGYPDSVIVLAVAAWPLWQGHLFAGLAAIAAFLLDGVLSRPNRKQLVFALAAALETGLFAVTGRGLAIDIIGPRVNGAVILASLLFLAVIGGSSTVEAAGDRTGRPLNPLRVQSAQVLALAWAFLAAVIGGEAAIIAIFPLWAGMIGTGLYRVVTHLTGREP